MTAICEAMGEAIQVLPGEDSTLLPIADGQTELRKALLGRFVTVTAGVRLWGASPALPDRGAAH
jgi:hypothetical protein